MKYCTDRAAVLLSVGELCGLALRPPDLDLRPGAARPGPERAARGRELHRLLQDMADRGYQAELPLTNTTLYNGVCYEVSGRADGVLRGAGDVVVFTCANLINLTIRVAGAFLLAPVVGVAAVWYAVPVGWTVNFLISFVRYLTGKWGRRNLVEAVPAR